MVRALLVCSGLLTALPCAASLEEPLTLNTALERAATKNERGQAASARAEAARARVRRARSVLFPDITATGTYQRRAYETVRTVGDQTVVLQREAAMQGMVGLRWTLLEPRALPLYRSARAEQDAASFEAAEAKRALLFDTADAFLITLSAEQVQDAAKRRLEFARQNFADVQARLRAGLVSSNDLTQAELEVASAERDLARIGGEAKVSRLELAYLIATPVVGPLEPPHELLEGAMKVEHDAGALVQRARAQRLDAAARVAQARAARLFAQEPLWRALPNISVTGQYRLTNEVGFSGRPSDGFVGLEAAWVLYDGGERYAERDERSALAQVAELAAASTDRRVAVDVEEALVTLQTAQAALKQAVVAASAAQKNAQETKELYRQGLVGALAVTDANLRRFEAEVALARERFGAGRALLGLYASVGLDPIGNELRP